jgi:hypothetical protein
MPGVLAAKHLRMFTSASLAALLRLCLKSTAGTDFELLASSTVAEAMQAIRNGQITAADVIVGFGGFIDSAADEAAERKLASKAKTIAEARDAGLLEVGLTAPHLTAPASSRRRSSACARPWACFAARAALRPARAFGAYSVHACSPDTPSASRAWLAWGEPSCFSAGSRTRGGDG